MRLLILIILLISCKGVLAQVGFALHFGQSGITQLSISEIDHPADIACSSEHVYLLSNGASSMDTNSQWVQVTRLLTKNGAVDTSFADYGTIQFEFSPFPFSKATTLDLDNNGNIYVFGTGLDKDSSIYEPVCGAKILPHGVLDSAFGIPTFSFIDAIEKVHNITIQDSSILLAGAAFERFTSVYLPAAAKLNLEGQMDSSFVGTGKAYINLWGGVFPFKTTHASGGEMFNMSMADEQGFWLAGGHSNGETDAAVVVKLQQDGTLDSTFNENGQLYLMPLLEVDHFAKGMHAHKDTLRLLLQLETDLERDIGLVNITPDWQVQVTWIDYSNGHDDGACYHYPFLGATSLLDDTLPMWTIFQFPHSTEAYFTHEFDIPSTATAIAQDNQDHYMLGQVNGKLTVAALGPTVISSAKQRKPSRAAYQFKNIDLLGRAYPGQFAPTMILSTDQNNRTVKKLFLSE